MEATTDRKERVNLPPDPNPRKPQMTIPPGAWDTHFHVLGPPHRFPYAEGRHATPPSAPIDHYLKMIEILGFERGVVVQPSAHYDDIASVLDAIEKSDGRLMGVIRGECLEGADLKALHRAGIRGVRVELRTEHREFDKASFDRMVEQTGAMGWAVALHVDATSIANLAETIAAIKATTIIENYAQIDARKGPDQPALKALVALAGEPHVWLKAASAYRMVMRGATWEQVRIIARIVHGCAPDKTIWGTDWPHTEIYQAGTVPNDGDLVDTLLDFVPDEINRRKLLVDNPKRLFDWA